MLCLMLTKYKHSTLYRSNITDKVKLINKHLEQHAPIWSLDLCCDGGAHIKGVEIFAVMNLQTKKLRPQYWSSYGKTNINKNRLYNLKSFSGTTTQRRGMGGVCTETGNITYAVKFTGLHLPCKGWILKACEYFYTYSKQRTTWLRSCLKLNRPKLWNIHKKGSRHPHLTITFHYIW